MRLEPGPVGGPVDLQLSGREPYLLQMRINEVVNQIDENGLKTVVGVDLETMRLVADNLTEVWWELDETERKTFVPGA